MTSGVRLHEGSEANGTLFIGHLSRPSFVGKGGGLLLRCPPQVSASKRGEEHAPRRRPRSRSSRGYRRWLPLASLLVAWAPLVHAAAQVQPQTPPGELRPTPPSAGASEDVGDDDNDTSVTQAPTTANELPLDGLLTTPPPAAGTSLAPPPERSVDAEITIPPRTPGRTPALVLTPSVEFNLRGQGRYNANFDPAPGDRSQDIFQRARLGLDARYGSIGVFIQAQDVRSWGFESSTLANTANTDLHQGYLYVTGSKGESRGRIVVGRQEINVGSGRLIANRNWVPVGQSFDALRLQGSYGRLSADAGMMLLARPSTFTIADPSGEPALEQSYRSQGTFSGYLLLQADFGDGAKIEALGVGVRERPTAASPAAVRDIINGGLRVNSPSRSPICRPIRACIQAVRPNSTAAR